MSAEDTTIYPTHSCFDDTIENLMAIMREEPTGRALVCTGQLLVVHGIIRDSVGEQMAHAWLEREGKWVIDSGILKGEKITYRLDLGEFYREVAPTETTKYTLFQARREELRTGHCGPWVPRYIELCGRESFSKRRITAIESAQLRSNNP